MEMDSSWPDKTKCSIYFPATESSASWLVQGKVEKPHKWKKLKTCQLEKFPPTPYFSL